MQRYFAIISKNNHQTCHTSMQINKANIHSLLLIISAALIITSCASSGYSLNEPHNYKNSYNQVIKGIEMILEDQKMVVTHAEKIDDKTYKIYFYKQASRIEERNFESGHTAEITVKKINDTRTSVEIEEVRTRALVRDDYREQLAKEVFRGLNHLLVLEEKV